MSNTARTDQQALALLLFNLATQAAATELEFQHGQEWESIGVKLTCEGLDVPTDYDSETGFQDTKPYKDVIHFSFTGANPLTVEWLFSELSNRPIGIAVGPDFGAACSALDLDWDRTITIEAAHLGRTSFWEPEKFTGDAFGEAGVAV